MTEKQIKFDSEVIRDGFTAVDLSESTPILKVIETFGELTELYGEYGIPEELSGFDEEYFAGKILVLIQTVPGSGSIKHESESVSEGENKLTVHIKRTSGIIQTMDLAVFTIAVGIDRSDYKGQEITCEAGAVAIIE